MKIRLNKYLSRCGVASRRKADEMIAAGRIKINRRVVREMGTRIVPGSDRVEVDGREVRPETKEYIILNKPPGYLVSRTDSHNRLTINALIPSDKHSLFPVGRLDRNSEGLLIMTNDGELAHRLMHPRYKVTKEYISEVKGHPGKRELEKIRKGVDIEGRPAVPDEVRVLKTKPDTTVFKIKLHEGRKREIRRLFDAAGHRVKTLQRVAIDGLRLGRLKQGRWRQLKPEEVKMIKTAVGLDRWSKGQRGKKTKTKIKN